jgi:two-component system sensor histidine kinase KdpD
MSSAGNTKPTPEELLRRIESEESNERRGRLKIFLGYAPRVGKSRRMFDEGVRRKRRGQDVVVGAIQSRGAADLAEKIACLEVVGGDTLDLERILQRHPQICLVDELAKDNPPGSRHPQRWQDVQEILRHGIQVITAVNIQYIEEMQDAVEEITGKRAIHTVPKSFIASADEIEVVDAPEDELAPADDHSAETRARLSRLREAALCLAAEVIDAQLERYMGLHGIRQAWGTQERILVCLTPRSNAATMLESGRRNADRFHGQLFAVYVAQENLERRKQEALDRNLALARDLGAETHILTASDPVDAILRFAEEHRITQIFIGHSQKSRWTPWVRQPADRVIDAAEGMDVRIFPQPHSL